ncbi:olfactory receptor 6Q1-like [Rhinatrema bivittatum]|uniref:olfactory receptor 6Q1-like n=1 Tax=Rhinatrema bivittatum TaxID=194408 RepID=UPI00112E982E|nr:olfactory receptor 6Q1-like [Rhinatrema bivittatum]
MERNYTIVTEFIILGFQNLQELHNLLFIVFLILYILTITGNVIILSVVRIDRQLHTPMYFFLSNLSILEITYTSVVVPKMLSLFLTGNNVISFTACMTQLLLFFFLGASECFLLAVMAYDRYLAICDPLHYASIMHSKVCIQLAVASWMLGFLTTFIPIILISRLSFCGPNVINHFFCDAPPILKLSCSDTHMTDIVDLICSSTVIVCSFALILVSYYNIMVTILKMTTAKGKRKALSTCASHLTSVVIFYAPGLFLYVRPEASSAFDSNKVVSLLNTIVSPVLNPMIYSLRNQEVKATLRKLIRRKLRSLDGQQR